MTVYDRLRPLYAKFNFARTSLQLRLGYRRAEIPAAPCGFFGNLFMTLGGIRLAESAGVQPQPKWGEECLFFEASRGPNAWLYYFDPVPPISPRFANSADDGSGKVFPIRPSAAVVSPVYPGMGELETYREIIRRYVHIRPEIKAEFENQIVQLFRGRPAIGVHIRQTDTTTGVEARQSFGLSKYCAAIDLCLEERPDAVLFVATDAIAAMDEMRQRYGQRVVAMDCIRSDGQQSIHGHYDGGVPGSPFQKGLEVLRDAYILSRVDHLIRGTSGVTTYSICLNADLELTEVGVGSLEQSMADTPWILKGLKKRPRFQG